MSNKYKIAALFGQAGTGKSFLQREVMNTTFGKQKLSKVVSCTTRPPRQGEKDGVDYHFIATPADFFKKKLIEYTEFRKWYYGTPLDNLSKDKINIGIFNIQGINSLLTGQYSEEVECIPIRIYCSDKMRLIRQLERESDPDCTEICRRFLTDRTDFINIPFHYYTILNNNSYQTSFVINDIINLISDHLDKKD